MGGPGWLSISAASGPSHKKRRTLEAQGGSRKDAGRPRWKAGGVLLRVRRQGCLPACRRTRHHVGCGTDSRRQRVRHGQDQQRHADDARGSRRGLQEDCELSGPGPLRVDRYTAAEMQVTEASRRRQAPQSPSSMQSTNSGCYPAWRTLSGRPWVSTFRLASSDTPFRPDDNGHAKSWVRARQRLTLRPCPSGDAPTGLSFLQGDSQKRADLLNFLSLLLEYVLRGNNNIGPVCSDIDVPGVAEGDDPISDSILFGVGVVVIHPLRTSPRTVPLVGRKFVND